MSNQTGVVVKFSTDVSGLSSLEKKVLKKLESAAELVGPIYYSQINDAYLGGNFYPHDATKEEILAASKKNPEILNPYTVVERDFKRNLIAIPYHIKYADSLKGVIKLLNEARELTDDNALYRRLGFQIAALESDDYEKSIIYWLSLENLKINIILGPVERYEDRLFFKKTSYMAIVQILNEPATREAEQLRDAMSTSQRKPFSLSTHVDAIKKILIRVDQTPVISGLAARALFSGYSLPNDSRLIEKYGVRNMILEPVVEFNFNELHLPLFKKMFQKDFQKGYSHELLIESAKKLLIVREISTNLVKYHGAEDRLGELFPVIEEMASYVISVKNAGALLVKDVISQKILEGMIILLLCQAFDLLESSKENKSLDIYRTGYSILINYFIESGALRESGGISWVNFTKIFIALSELAVHMEQILAFGDVEDVRQLIEKYGRIDHLWHKEPRKS